jgi:leader peptidase (prepilin peptidase)/N-methyltransferase
LRDVQTLLVAGTSVAGLVIGGVLDPLGQRLADLSRAEDERRRAEEAAEQASRTEHLRLDEPIERAPAGPAVVPETAPPAGPAPVPEAASLGEAVPPATVVPAPEAIRHLLPSGQSPGRTVGAAVVTGALFGAAAHHFGRDVVLAPFCVFFALLVAVSTTDLSHRLVPRRLIYGGTALIVPLLVLTSAVDHRWHSLTGSAVAGAVSFLAFFAVWWFVPRGMGFGDVRLAAVIGITVGYLSLLHAYVAFLAGFVMGMVFGLVMMVVSSAGRRTRIPFAPSLAVGAVIAVLWGATLAQHLFHVSN